MFVGSQLMRFFILCLDGVWYNTRFQFLHVLIACDTELFFYVACLIETSLCWYGLNCVTPGIKLHIMLNHQSHNIIISSSNRPNKLASHIMLLMKVFSWTSSSATVFYELRSFHSQLISCTLNVDSYGRGRGRVRGRGRGRSWGRGGYGNYQGIIHGFWVVLW